jgi:hypothetical protein
MNTYVIRRLGGWRTEEQLEAATGRWMRVAEEEMPDEIRWVRSYVVRERDGRLGTFCICEASSAERIREHAFLAAIPASMIYETAA